MLSSHKWQFACIILFSNVSPGFAAEASWSSAEQARHTAAEPIGILDRLLSYGNVRVPDRTDAGDTHICSASHSSPRLRCCIASEACHVMSSQASLQLLEASNISSTIGRLRRHSDTTVAMKAEQLAQRWHATASAVYVHAKQHLGNA